MAIWFTARELGSVLRSEAKSTWGGTRLDPLTFLVQRDASARFSWRVVADCANPSRTGFGGAEQIPLRTFKGFTTKEGAIGHLSEVAALLAPRFPQVRLVMRALPNDPLWFSKEENQWRPFPERTWACPGCSKVVVWPPFLGVADGIPLCEDCNLVMCKAK